MEERTKEKLQFDLDLQIANEKRLEALQEAQDDLDAYLASQDGDDSEIKWACLRGAIYNARQAHQKWETLRVQREVFLLKSIGPKS